MSWRFFQRVRTGTRNLWKSDWAHWLDQQSCKGLSIDGQFTGNNQSGLSTQGANPSVPDRKSHMLDYTLHGIYPITCCESWCEVIDDSMFWEGLEHVVGDLKPICYATNIGQRDSTCADTILLGLVGISLHFSKHPIKTVATVMSKCIVRQWKDCDQLLFLLCLVLNPFEILSRFGEKAGLNQFKWKDMLLQVSILLWFLYDLYLPCAM